MTGITETLTMQAANFYRDARLQRRYAEVVNHNAVRRNNY